MANLPLSSCIFILLGCLTGSACFGQLSTQHVFSSYQNTATLVIVEQLGDDVSISVSGGDDRSFTIDHAIGRTGPEYLLLEPSNSRNPYTLKILSSSNDPQYSVQSYELPNHGNPYKAAKLISSAGTLTSSNEYHSIRDAITLYQEASSLGIAAYNLSRYATFLYASLLSKESDFSSALDALSTIENSDFLGDFRYKLAWLRANILFSQDNYIVAKQDLEKTLIEMHEYPGESSNTILDRAELNIVLGFSLVLTGDPDSGKKYLDSALEVAENYADQRLIGMAHNNLGGYFSLTRNQNSAIVHLRLARDHLSKSTDIQTLIFSLSNLSTTYLNSGKIQLARETAHFALGLAEKRSNPSELSAAYTRLTDIYLRLGEYQVAEEFAQASQQYDIGSDREWRSYTMGVAEGDALMGQLRPLDAMEKYQNAANYFKANGPPSRQLGTLLRLADASLLANDLDNAENYLLQANELIVSTPEISFDSLHNRMIESQARLFLKLGLPERVLSIIENIEDAEFNLAIPANIKKAHLLMQSHEALGNIDLAVKFGEIAVDHAVGIRKQLEFARLGPAWAKETYPVFQNLIHNLMSLYADTGDKKYAHRAFQVAELGQAFNLGQQRELSSQSSGEASKESQDLRKEVAVLARQRASFSESDLSSHLDIEYFKALERYQASLNLLPQSNWTETPAVSDIQRSIPTDTAILQYTCVPGKNCYLFVLTRDIFEAFNVDLYEDIEILTLAAQQQLRNPYTRHAAAVDNLGDTLFKPQIVNLFDEKIQHLKFVTSYPLNSIPLGVLSIRNSQGMEPLISKFQTSLLPSVGTFLRYSGIANYENHDYELAVLADPEFTASSDPLIELASRSDGDSLRGWYDGLNRLPWSAREAENLANIFSSEKILTMTGKYASKSNLLAESTRNSRIVHIASHGYFNRSTPDLVGIATAPSENDNGFVSLEDLLMHPFNSELVVISGCETGLGENRGGEGMMSLSRAFLGQGVRHVISTHWPVSDRASAEFMNLFYNALYKEKKDITEALQIAQLKLSQNSNYRAPFYWAPYVLTSISD